MEVQKRLKRYPTFYMLENGYLRMYMHTSAFIQFLHTCTQDLDSPRHIHKHIHSNIQCMHFIALCHAQRFISFFYRKQIDTKENIHFSRRHMVSILLNQNICKSIVIQENIVNHHPGRRIIFCEIERILSTCPFNDTAEMLLFCLRMYCILMSVLLLHAD